MAGPWLGIGYDEDYLTGAKWRPGDIIETVAYDYEHKAQGNIVLVIIGDAGKQREYLGTIVAVEDDYYSWWAFDSGECEQPGLFRMAAKKGEKGKERDGRYVSIVQCWLLLGAGGIPDLAPLTWLRKGLRATVEGRIAEALPRAKVAGAAGLPERALRPRLFGDDEGKHHDRKDVTAELLDLRESVDRDRGRRHAPRADKAPSGGRGRESPPPRRVHRRDGDGRAAAAGSGGRRREDVKDKDEARSPRRTVADRPARRTPSPGRDGRGRRRSSGAGRSTGDRRRSGSRDRRRSSSRSRRRRRDSSSRSRSRSVFHEASSSSSRHTQARLLSWAQRHPGRLAARLLQSMEDRVGRDGEAGAWAPDAMPAAAKSYFYRVLRVSHSTGNLRNMREMATLCYILDHLAKGRNMAAADVAGQRLKAVEAAIVDGNWDRAQFLELVEPDGPLLAERQEQHMTARELELKQRLAGGWGSSWRPRLALHAPDKGYEKGSGKKGSGKKGKGGGKGKWGKEAPPPKQE